MIHSVKNILQVRVEGIDQRIMHKHEGNRKTTYDMNSASIYGGRQDCENNFLMQIEQKSLKSKEKKTSAKE